MTIEEDVIQITSILRNQVRALQSSLKDVEDQVRKDAPKSDLFVGPMISSLLTQEDPVWFAKFLHSMEGSLNTQHLVLITLLAHQQRFKQLLLTSPELQVALIRPLKVFTPDQADIDSVLWYKALVYALIKSKQDKPRIIAPQFKSAGFTFTEQSKLEESLSHNPRVASALGSGAAIEEWSTEIEDANKILSWLMGDSFMKSLVSSKAGETLACICRVPEYRALVIKCGGVQTMLDWASRLNNEPEKKEQIQVALARLCMNTDPRLWKYPQIVDLSSACYDLICNSDYELYMYEAGFGLTNLLAASPAVVDFIGGKEESLVKFFDLVAGSRDDRVQLVGVELVCNLCCSDEVVSRVADEKYMEQLKILPFLIENGSDHIQSAASGALAILSSNDGLVNVIERLTSNGDMLTSKLHSENLSPDVQLRVASIISNIVDYTDESAIRDKLRNELVELKKQTQDIPENERLLSLIQSYS